MSKDGLKLTENAARVYNSRRGRLVFRLKPQHVVSDATGGVRCEVCGVTFLALPAHINRIHGITGEQYRFQHGRDKPLMISELKKVFGDAGRRNAIALHEAKGMNKCQRCGCHFETWGHRGNRGRDKRALYCSWACEKASASELRRTSEFHRAVIRANAQSAAAKAYREQRTAESIKNRTRLCVVCGKEWVASKSCRVGLCSIECRDIEMRRRFVERRTEPCAVCGIMFLRSRYARIGICSYACRTKHRRSVLTAKPCNERTAKRRAAWLNGANQT